MDTEAQTGAMSTGQTEEQRELRRTVRWFLGSSHADSWRRFASEMHDHKGVMGAATRFRPGLPEIHLTR